MKYYRRPSALHKINYGMADNAEFIITNDQCGVHSDLGNCIIGTRPPFFVAKIHAFRTQEKRDKVRIQQEKERIEWLQDLVRREQLAQEARKEGISVRDLMERHGDTYDEELDEFRLVAKVPGLNVYLELYGCMGQEDSCMENRWQDDCGLQQPFDRAIDAAAMQQLNRAAYFYRVTTTKNRQRDLATMTDDWQPRDDWHEEYDYNEFFQRPERKGIGFDYIDSMRRPASFPKHNFTDEERDEYIRLRAEEEKKANQEGRTLTDHDRARLQQQAAYNVAQKRKMEQ